MIRLVQMMVLGSHEEITWPYQPEFFTINYALLPKHALWKHSCISSRDTLPRGSWQTSFLFIQTCA
jgi:hypothetical protein